MCLKTEAGHNVSSISSDAAPKTDSHIVLPADSSVISATGYGGSFWSQTGKIIVRLADGTTEAYLIKVCPRMGVQLP